MRLKKLHTKKNFQHLIGLGFILLMALLINPHTTYAQDSDGDGTLDVNDLDDDNDGIPDASECNLGPELILNGGFEDAYAHWTSDFNRGRNNNGPTSGSCSAQGWVAISPCASTNGTCPTYYDYNGGTPTGSTIITDAYGTGANVLPTTNCNTTAGSCLAEALADHTTGSGFSVYVDPNDIAGESYWIQTITVEAGKTYAFSAWIMVIEEDPNLEFIIDGVSLTGGVNLDRLTGGSNGTDEWQELSAIWNSGVTSGNVVIELANLTTGCNGNDIRIDDISFRKIICDTDGDGIANALDLDGDNDGIPDIIEAGGIDTDGDGRVDYPTPGDPTSMVDVDNDGLEDSIDNEGGSVTSGTPLPIPNTDGDIGADFLDVDADNDGITDIIEAGGIDTDGNGKVDTSTDSDSDGLADTVDPTDDGPTSGTGNTGTPNVATNGSGTMLDGVAGTSLDNDGDGHVDHLDLDADNDGITDIIEGGGTDTNGDGLVDTSTDSDSDGLANTVDPTDDGPTSGTGNTGTPNVATNGSGNMLDGVAGTSLDSDGDGFSDHLDLDADNDGIPDLVEAGGIDTNGDGTIDTSTDSDSDGLADTVDPTDDGPTSGTGNTGTPNVATNGSGTMLDGVAGTSLDSDGDSHVDHLDLDADNDGIPDLVEAGGIDTDGNGRVDAAFSADADNDGYADTYDSDDNTVAGTDDGGTPMVETDGSGNLLDGQDASSLDTDGDGLADHLDLDADNDGIADIAEAGGVDVLGLGGVDTGAAPWDADGDGLADVYDQSADDGPDGTGTNGTALVMTTADTDADGQVDAAGENMIAGSAANNINMDGDAVPNHLDLDADNDGIVDLIETGGTDSNDDGMVDDLSTNDADGNGWLDAMSGVIRTTGDGADGNPYVDYTTGPGNYDFDGDGQADYLDIDADNDGIVDNTEGQATAAYISPTTDSDGDGLNDAYEAAGTIGSFGGVGIAPVNTDGIDNMDYLDLDSDNDAEPDTLEGHDSDNDGVADSGSTANTGLATGLDIDFDGLDDGFDNNASSPDATNTNTNPSTHPDTPDSGIVDRDWRATNRNIAGFVWEDTSEDGVLDNGEPMVANATVTIYDSGDMVYATVMTEADGSYRVTDIPAGTYYVIFTKPAAYGSSSPQDAGAATEETDSDANGTGQTGNYVVVTDNADIYISAGFFGAPLPIELLSFTAKAEDCDVLLRWEVGNSVNFSHFEVQRSTDGLNFIEAQSLPYESSNRSSNYQHLEVEKSVANYYRLKLVDLDGSYEYSSVVFVKTNCGAENGGHAFSLYPNPLKATQPLQIIYSQTSDATAIYIVDGLGRKVKQVPLGLEKQTIDISELQPGTYMMLMESSSKIEAQRFVISE